MAHKDKIIIVLGAHTHFMDLWYDDEDNEAFFSLISTPSFSPEFNNNPGYTTFEILNGSIFNLEFTYLNLTKTYGPAP